MKFVNSLSSMRVKSPQDCVAQIRIIMRLPIGNRLK